MLPPRARGSTIKTVNRRPDHTSDEELARRAAAGDRDAAAEIVRRYQSPVLGLCTNLVGPADAEDLAQDALVRVLTRLDRFSGGSALGTWIYRLTTNLCLSHLRRRKRNPVRTIPDPQHASQNREPGRVPGVQTGETRLRVQRALLDLPDDQRAILVLRDARGLGYEQLAEVLEIPLGTVRSRLFRARRALADRLEHDSRLGTTE
jgi:RNA polymerase sigma-70 factor (ECF subfamily)